MNGMRSAVKMPVAQFKMRRKLQALLYLLLFAVQWDRCMPWIAKRPPWASVSFHPPHRGQHETAHHTLRLSSLGSSGYLESMGSGPVPHAASSASPSPSGLSPPPMLLHHTCLKTRNITTAMQFYSLFGYQVEGKFRAGPARAAWLEIEGSQHRLELIEIPAYILNERLGQKRRALDLMERQDLLGYNHVALDVTNQIVGNQTLAVWIDNLNKVSLHRFGKSLRVALEPKQQLIGNAVFELAFLYDADGCLVELLRYQTDLPQEINSGWDPWDGEGFVGPMATEEGEDGTMP